MSDVNAETGDNFLPGMPEVMARFPDLGDVTAEGLRKSREWLVEFTQFAFDRVEFAATRGDCSYVSDALDGYLALVEQFSSQGLASALASFAAQQPDHPQSTAYAEYVLEGSKKATEYSEAVRTSAQAVLDIEAAQVADVTD